MSVLHVDIAKRLGDFSLRVLFSVENETLALLGASGCGKSMTLKCIAGVEKPDSGVIVLNGKTLFDAKKQINLPPQQRNVGFLFQNYALFPNMTVAQNIRCALHRCADKCERQKNFLKITDTFRLASLLHHYPHQLSGGQQQRVALARILASNPAILLLDEPFSSLDSFLKSELELELSDMLKGFSGPTVYVSHDRDEVYRLADRVCVMDGGKTEDTIPVGKLFSDPQTLAAATLSGCKNFSRAAPLDGKHVAATDWGCTLAVNGTIPRSFSFVGVRAHFIRFAPAKTVCENCFAVRVERVIDNVFSTVFIVHPSAAREGEGRIRVELAKSVCTLSAGDDACIVIDPSAIMILK